MQLSQKQKKSKFDATAIVSSLASLSNSVSTIFTMDIYRKDQDINDPSLVNIGRIAGLTGLVISIIVAPIFLGSLPSAFQYVQEGFLAR